MTGCRMRCRLAGATTDMPSRGCAPGNMLPGLRRSASRRECHLRCGDGRREMYLERERRCARKRQERTGAGWIARRESLRPDDGRPREAAGCCRNCWQSLWSRGIFDCGSLLVGSFWGTWSGWMGGCYKYRHTLSNGTKVI